MTTVVFLEDGPVQLNQWPDANLYPEGTYAYGGEFENPWSITTDFEGTELYWYTPPIDTVPNEYRAYVLILGG